MYMGREKAGGDQNGCVVEGFDVCEMFGCRGNIPCI